MNRRHCLLTLCGSSLLCQSPGFAQQCYTLDAERRTLLQIHNLTGRAVRTLCASSVKRGAYSVTWDGRDHLGRSLAHGVYFCRFTAGDYRATEKVVLQK